MKNKIKLLFTSAVVCLCFGIPSGTAGTEGELNLSSSDIRPNTQYTEDLRNYNLTYEKLFDVLQAIKNDLETATEEDKKRLGLEIILKKHDERGANMLEMIIYSRLTKEDRIGCWRWTKYARPNDMRNADYLWTLDEGSGWSTPMKETDFVKELLKHLDT